MCINLYYFSGWPGGSYKSLRDEYEGHKSLGKVLFLDLLSKKINFQNFTQAYYRISTQHSKQNSLNPNAPDSKSRNFYRRHQ